MCVHVISHSWWILSQHSVYVAVCIPVFLINICTTEYLNCIIELNVLRIICMYWWYFDVFIYFCFICIFYVSINLRHFSLIGIYGMKWCVILHGRRNVWDSYVYIYLVQLDCYQRLSVFVLSSCFGSIIVLLPIASVTVWTNQTTNHAMYVYFS